MNKPFNGRRAVLLRAVTAVSAVVLYAAALGPAHAGALTSLFASNNGQSGNMFDVNVFGNALTVSSIDLNLETGASSNLEIYTKSGTWVGSETTPGDWTLLDSINGLASNGTDIPTNWDLLDFVLPANMITALYVTATNGTSLNYTNGTGVGNVAAQNADLQILEGAGKAYPFSNTFQPRIWNGTIRYEAGVIPEPATLALLSVALAGLGFSRRRKLH